MPIRDDPAFTHLCDERTLPLPHAQAAYVQDYAQRCSRIARAFSIGKSAQGTELWALELGVSRGEDVAKPRFKYLVRPRAVGRLPESSAEGRPGAHRKPLASLATFHGH